MTTPPDSPSPSSIVLDSTKIFNRLYFENYRGQGQFYWDHPSNEIVFRKVMDRRPESVLELGCGRGYVLKRLEDAGVKTIGFDISKHCHMTRASDKVYLKDLMGKWNISAGNGGLGTLGGVDSRHDLCLSIGVLEHIPEALIPAVLAEASRTSRRQLHAITFEGTEPWPDKTRVTLKPAEWWFELFRKTGTKAEVVPFHEFLSGSLPPEYVKGDGKVKLNVGCFMTMFHNGWVNMDVHDLRGFAQGFGYDYRIHDATLGLPFGTGTVDLIYSSHMLEHLSYAEGVSFLRECRRVIRPDGAMRIIVPDAYRLMGSYAQSNPIDSCQDTPGKQFPFLSDYDEINEGCANAPTGAGKLWSLLHEGHKACYDAETLCGALREGGWEGKPTSFRKFAFGDYPYGHSGLSQILRETLDMLPCLSLFCDAVPRVG